MTPMQIIFLVFAAVTLVSAVLVVSVRKMMHAALWLVLALFGVAVLFVLLDSGFFAVVQVLIYIGAIAILVIFATMLTHRVMQDEGTQVNRGWWVAAGAAVLLLIGLLAALAPWGKFSALTTELPKTNLLADLGQALASPDGFVIPFEVASVLLLAAMIGAIYIATQRKGGKG